MLEINSTIKKYKVTKAFEAGGFCKSYFVSDGTNEYFMKEYSDPTQTSSDFVPFYDNQVILIERLNAMGSITEKFVDHFIENGLYYQVKEKLKGIDLQNYLSTHLEDKDRLALSNIFCGIMRSLHSQNIVHQDLKPAQVMMVDDELGKKTKLGYRIILSDFDWSIPDGKMVRKVGTLYYKSPEHYIDGPPTLKSDIYTVGIMIYEFLTGQSPYESDVHLDDDAMKKIVLTQNIKKTPADINPAVSKVVNDIVMRCFNVDPDKRPSLEELQNVFSSPEGKTPVNISDKQIYIKSEKDKYLVYSSSELTRKDFKTFFGNTLDEDGDPVYKYLEDGKPALCFYFEADNTYSINTPQETKNYFLLNDGKVSVEKLKIKKGDILEIFSTSKSKKIAKFELS